MRREEKRRKFNEAVVNYLYPPPPSPTESEDEEGPPTISPVELNVDSIPLPGDSGCSGGSLESDDNDEDDGRKGRLTRAQRKRIRKKRLREESARRGKLIGPLLPSSKDDESGGVQENETPVVRRNAEVEPAAGNAAASTKQRSLKHRRMVKKQAKGTLKQSDTTQDE